MTIEWRPLSAVTALVKNIFVLCSNGEVKKGIVNTDKSITLDWFVDEKPVAWCTREQGRELISGEWMPVYPIEYTKYLKKEECSFPLGKNVEVWINPNAIVEAHWAADLSGSDQPQFIGWFKKCGDGYYQIETPKYWREKGKENNG